MVEESVRIGENPALDEAQRFNQQVSHRKALRRAPRRLAAEHELRQRAAPQKAAEDLQAIYDFVRLNPNKPVGDDEMKAVRQVRQAMFKVCRTHAPALASSLVSTSTCRRRTRPGEAASRVLSCSLTTSATASTCEHAAFTSVVNLTTSAFRLSLVCRMSSQEQALQGRVARRNTRARPLVWRSVGRRPSRHIAVAELQLRLLYLRC